MERIKALLQQILQVTTELETYYPELYQYLGETPITLPDDPHPKMDEKALQDYLNTLQEMLKLRLNRPTNLA